MIAVVIDILTEGSLFLCGIHPSPCKENAGQGSFGVLKTRFMLKSCKFLPFPKIFGKSKNLQFFKKIVLKNSETRFQKAETRFQNAETRFQNAKTALSRIFFARAWLDSAKKSLNFDQVR